MVAVQLGFKRGRPLGGLEDLEEEEGEGAPSLPAVLSPLLLPLLHVVFVVLGSTDSP